MSEVVENFAFEAAERRALMAVVAGRELSEELQLALKSGVNRAYERGISLSEFNGRLWFEATQEDMEFVLGLPEVAYEEDI